MRSHTVKRKDFVRSAFEAQFQLFPQAAGFYAIVYRKYFIKEKGKRLIFAL